MESLTIECSLPEPPEEGRKTLLQRISPPPETPPKAQEKGGGRRKRGGLLNKSGSNSSGWKEKKPEKTHTPQKNSPLGRGKGETIVQGIVTGEVAEVRKRGPTEFISLAGKTLP